MLRMVYSIGRRACGGEFQGQAFAGVFHKRLARGDAKLPEHGIRRPANILPKGLRRSQPAVLSTGLRPKIVGRSRVPGGHVDSVGHVSYRYFVLRPARKQRQKEAPAHLSVQAAYAIYRSAPSNRQICHVKTLRRVARVLAAKGQQIVTSDAELLFGIPAKILCDEGGRETVKTGGHCRVGSEEIARSCDRQCDCEGLPSLFHEVARTFQDGKRRVPFIHVTDLRLDPERAE